MEKKKINKIAFWPAIIILLCFIAAGIIWTEQVGAIMTKLLYGMANFFGAYINILSFEYQRDKKGFSMIEVLSPCSTNWKLSPVDAMAKIRNENEKIFPVKTYVDNGENR